MSPADTKVREAASGDVIAVIAFRGGEWQTDSDIRSVIAQVIRDHEPAAILLDLSDFRYHGGDYASGFLDAFFDRGARRKRPACFVGADRALAALFNKIDDKGVFGIRYFNTQADAMYHLEQRLGQTG